MSSSFVVYIDESGDEGFKFGPEGAGGSSTWFVLSAAITHKETDLETVKLVDKVRQILQRKPDDQEPLHFRTLKHQYRVPYIDQISKANLKTVSILWHKPSIRNVEIFQQKNRLYFYTARYLLERVSWYCRDHRPSKDLGDGTADVVFSNRGGMEYDAFRDYMLYLKDKSGILEVQIDWDVIRAEQIRTEPATRLMGFQIADAVASGLFFGVQLDRYGFCEEKYAKMLKPVVYSKEGRYKGYGLKFFPTAECDELIQTKSHLQWLQETYNF